MATLMQLGDFKFEVLVNSFDKISKKKSWRWGEQNHIGGASQLHYTGKNADTWTISGTIYTSFSGRRGFGTIEQLEIMGDSGETHFLMDDAGNTFGRWAISSLDHTDSFFLDNGLPVKIEFKLTLKKDVG